MDGYRGILVYCEIKSGKVIENSLELLGEALRLKEKLKHRPEVSALLIGENVQQYIDTVQGYGAEKIITFENDKLKLYRPDYYSEVLTKIIQKYKPEIVLTGATLQGEEIGPCTAKKLNTGMAAHCVEFKVLSDDTFVQVVPAFGGKVLGDIICPNFRPQMASVKAGLMKKAEYNKNNKAVIENYCDEIVGFGDKIEIMEITETSRERKILNKSDLIVGGGFGIGNKNVWRKLETLANALGGAVGCTRPALDEKWTEFEETMIGTSGVAVSPKIYLDIGVSGATQHTCGIKDSGIIISVNKDENAPIFEVSDYKVVEDGEKIIDALMLVTFQKCTFED